MYLLSHLVLGESGRASSAFLSFSVFKSLHSLTILSDFVSIFRNAKHADALMIPS